MMRIYKEFGFEAAYRIGDGPLCGQSFQARIAIEGEIDPGTGMIRDFCDLETAVKAIRAKLDHACLNDVPGLEGPTLERVAEWIWRTVKPDYAGLVEVAVYRQSRGEGCVYTKG